MPSDELPGNRTVRPDVTMDYVGEHDTSTAPGDTSEAGPANLGDRLEAGNRADKKARTPKRIASYEILAEIGRGGMGVVYKAEDPRLKRNVALKVILAGGHAGDVELARFQIEAESVARLKHHTFVQIYEVGADEGLPFLALEYCGGGSLEDRIDESPLASRESAELVAKLAEAMEYAHQAGVIHRDLKPGNVLFDDSGEPKITDFGLAKKVGEDDSHTRTVSVMGSLGYMSPEQASGHTREATPAVDVYALGAILYRLLAGKTPFEGSSTAESLQLVINGVPVPIRRLRPSCSRDLETICLKCLEKSPANRYQTAGDLADDLRRFLKGEPITARAATPFEQLVSWARRNPLPSTIAVGGVVMLALLAGAMAWTTYRNYRVIEAIQRHEMRVQDLRAQILFLDEVLTNSCSLAAATGEPRWEERYRRVLPELDAAIAQAIELVPSTQSELAAVGDANAALVQLEDQAFALVRQHEAAKAWELLNGEEYLGKKHEYTDGLAAFSKRLEELSEVAIQAAHREAMSYLIAALVLGGVVALILLMGFISLFRVLQLRSVVGMR
ncbi:serine/threonine-protein kinase [Lacipirellula parvula]|uniref:non-specific serine/threonine protein kinase n=1 Tax=Lacipirellula parvula TaxID=2650471 RepID=A0A5K7XF36_9BACT|nr:serine/threonine-protein kinase [Lacipirellula parvula]BBO34612.1 serine/threonine protein kinase [Lacipirellula parvula]